MSETISKKPQKRNTQSIGVLAAQGREQLQKMKEAHRRLQEESRLEKEEFEKKVAELESRERRDLRDQNRKEKQRSEFLLGEMVLTAMCDQGMARFSVTDANLNALKLEYQMLIERVVLRELSARDERKTKAKTSVVDIQLPPSDAQ